MRKQKRINKTGVTLLSILLITSLVAIASLITAIACCVQIHNLKEQVKTLQTIEAPAPVEIVEPTPEPQPEPEPEPEPKLISIGEFKITGYDAYCEHCCGKTDGITASMTQATVGRTVAMNRTDMKALGISYGDTIYIDGIGERVVEDTGCGRGVIDVVCIDHAACYKVTGHYNIYVKR